MRDRGLHVLGEAGRMRASLCVVESLRAISHRDEWTAVLSGGSQVDSGFFRRGGTGASIAFQPDVATPRRIWISDKFRELHPGLGKVMDAAISIPVSKWACLPSKDKVLELSRKMYNSGRWFRALGLVAVSDQRDGEACMMAF